MKNAFNLFFSNHIITLFKLIILFPFIIPAHSQNITNESNLFIPSGMELHTNGNVTNSGFFQNNGSFFLGGDWTNSSVYQGTGKLSLEGVNQMISNNNQDIEQLTIKGGGVKTIRDKLTIITKIDFLFGVVFVGDADTLLVKENCLITSASGLSYVDGALIAKGSGYKFFPIGKNGNYQPVELVNVKGINPTIEMEVFEDLPAVETSFPTALQRGIYWSRKTISGIFDGSPVTLGYSLQGITNLSRLVVLEGERLEDVFSVTNNITFNTSSQPNITSTDGVLTKNIFALGELLIDPPREYYLSTTLSPNSANPENRSIKVFGDTITPVDFSFQVFNRWGLLIFETDSFDRMNTQGWDGSQHGNVIPSGVYPYSLKYVEVSGLATQRAGFLTIIH